MILSEAIKMTLRYRQLPMTVHQIAYFLSFNNIVRTDSLKETISRVEEEVYLHPGMFTVSEDRVAISAWQEREQQVMEHVFGTVRQAISLFRDQGRPSDSCNNIVLALLLYKRLSDIKRSQQLGAPIVPIVWKFDRVVHETMVHELSSQVYEVMDYIERTDDRLANAFLYGKEELNHINCKEQLHTLQLAMRQLATLQLDEEHMPTPLFQGIFSHFFWNNVKQTSRELEAMA